MKIFVAFLLSALLLTSLNAQDFVVVRSITINSIGYNVQGSTTNLNATGNYTFGVGRLFLENSAAGPKTCSTSGCEIGIFVDNATWADNTTVFRIGLQDVNTSTGFPDTTFDVSTDLSPGTETIASNTIYTFAAESGTKTVSHGDIFCWVGLMANRGSTDAVAIEKVTRDGIAPFGFPYGGNVLGGTPSKSGDTVFLLIKFDDGTLGWFQDLVPLRNTALTTSTLTVNTGTTPDEVAAVIQVPVKLQTDGFSHFLSAIAATDTFEYVIYSDPMGSPAIIWGPVTVDPDQVVNNAIARSEDILTLQPNTQYGFSFRPTSANSISYNYFVLPTTGVAPFMKRSQFFTEILIAGRSDQTGGFTEISSTQLPSFALSVYGFISEPYDVGSNFPALFLAP